MGTGAAGAVFACLRPDCACADKRHSARTSRIAKGRYFMWVEIVNTRGENGKFDLLHSEIDGTSDAGDYGSS